MLNTLKVKILNDKIGAAIPMPEYSTQGSAGLDLRACIDDKLVISPGETKLIPTGLAIYIEDNNYAANCVDEEYSLVL